MAQTFYRKYRPDRFKDIVGQETATTILTQSLLQDKVSHAYLFTGPRGTGKTTLARLYAKALNCEKRGKKDFEPCGKCRHCVAQEEGRSLDIIEIDAASHTGVDNIRELRETVAASPVMGKYKVYIIDEAHMLSIGAWNALLKTLEEPPAHVVFILATTTVHKVPETILSRTLRLDLKRFPVEKIVEKLERIAKAEKIKIEKAALVQVARAAQGGMRDAEVLFTQIATLEESPIDEKRVAMLLGTTSLASQHALIASIADDDLPRAFAVIRELKDWGANFSHFASALLEYLRHALFVAVDKTSAEKLITSLTKEERAELLTVSEKLGAERIVECLERFQEAERMVKTSPLPELPLEIAVVKLIRTADTLTPPSAPSQKKESRAQAPLPQPKRESEPKKSVETKKTVAAEKTSAPTDLARTLREWPVVMKQAIATNASLGVALSTATTRLEANRFILEVKYPFHRERLEKPANKLTLNEAFVTILGFQVPFSVVESKRDAQAIQTERPAIIDQALTMLGGKLVGNDA